MVLRFFLISSVVVMKVTGSQKDFKSMYGSDAQYINVQNVSAIARTINKKMLAQ